MDLAGRKVLVTGADGFIGSHLTELLLQEGCQVRALCQYNSFGSWGWLEGLDLPPAAEVVAGDVRDPHFCRWLAREMEVIFHLAALIAIPYSYQAPASYLATNVQGTLNICQAALDGRCQRLIQTSTSEVYGTARYVPMDEGHPLQAQSPYAASKIGADAVAVSFHRAFGLPVTVARPFNTYGPRQSARAVIPTIISQIAAGQERIRLGDLTPTRDLNYVEDTCRGLMALAACDAAVGETVNVGSGQEIAVGELAALIARLMGQTVSIEADPQRLRPPGSEVFRLCCDNRRLRQLTGFAHQISLDEGLLRTIAWFRNPAHLSRYKADLYNV
ncbi:MAG: GDP-mannose 4,6-dehydratase [Thermodesulfobacteriota bacterium]